MNKKTGIVLFNLGGPDSLEAVKPFLFNLFYDKAIISLPNPFRYFLARLISSKREKTAQDIYSNIGGKSPILEQTKKQEAKLEKKLNDLGDGQYKVFTAMRYWHPFAEEALEGVINYNPDDVILLPLYPQFSTTTTGSSFNEWEKLSLKKNFDVPTSYICCYPTEDIFIKSHISLINSSLSEIKDKENIRFLFSAHGLPEKIIKKGDPYQFQVEKTVEKIVKGLGIKNIDYTVCYQSRVGRLKWIEPSTDDEILRAGKESKDIVLIPVAFVSEHSETLVELDIEYKELADNSGVKNYYRVPALSDDDIFIESLANICLNMPGAGKVCSGAKSFSCNQEFSKCPKTA